MPHKKISQREARRSAKELAELRRLVNMQRRRWAQTFIGGIEITSTAWTDANSAVPTALRTARALGHAVVAVGDETGKVRFVALPMAERA